MEATGESSFMGALGHKADKAVREEGKVGKWKQRGDKKCSCERHNQWSKAAQMSTLFLR